MLLSLTGICIVVAGILAFLNDVTAKPIEEAKIKAKVEAIANVTPKFDNNPYEEKFEVAIEGEADKLTVYPAKQGEKVVGYAIETYTKSGFSGLITLMMGIDATGKLVDYSVLEISETPGLGSKIPEWFHMPSKNTGNIQDVRGVDLTQEVPMKVTQDGGKVDAITAATISSRAFLDAINRGFAAYLATNSTK